jgi:predicted nucleic acid-binding protein
MTANLFLYAYNSDAPRQGMAAAWLRKLLESRETIALPWVTIWAFIRISTNSRTALIRDRPRMHLRLLANGWRNRA